MEGVLSAYTTWRWWGCLWEKLDCWKAKPVSGMYCTLLLDHKGVKEGKNKNSKENQLWTNELMDGWIDNDNDSGFICTLNVHNWIDV